MAVPSILVAVMTAADEVKVRTRGSSVRDWLDHDRMRGEGENRKQAHDWCEKDEL